MSSSPLQNPDPSATQSSSESAQQFLAQEGLNSSNLTTHDSQHNIAPELSQQTEANSANATNLPELTSTKSDTDTGTPASSASNYSSESEPTKTSSKTHYGEKNQNQTEVADKENITSKTDNFSAQTTMAATAEVKKFDENTEEMDKKGVETKYIENKSEKSEQNDSYTEYSTEVEENPKKQFGVPSIPQDTGSIIQSSEYTTETTETTETTKTTATNKITDNLENNQNMNEEETKTELNDSLEPDTSTSSPDSPLTPKSRQVPELLDDTFSTATMPPSKDASCDNLKSPNSPPKGSPPEISKDLNLNLNIQEITILQSQNQMKTNNQEEDPNQNQFLADSQNQNLKSGKKENILITVVDAPKTKQVDEENEPEIPPLDTERVLSRYSEDELEAVLKKFMKTNELPSFEMRPDVTKYARRKSIAAMLNEDYDEAEKFENAAQQLQSSSQVDNTQFEAEITTRNLNSKLEIAKQQEKEIQKIWGDRIQALNQEEQMKAEKLQKEHEIAIKKFEERWSSEEATIPFSKPSVTLLQLRKQQKAFALAKNFQDAKKIKIKADKLQKSEAEMAQRRATAVMKTEYAQLIERQKRESECWTANYARKRSELEAKRDVELAANQNLQKQLLSKIENPKLPKRPHVMLPVVTRSPRIEGREINGGIYSNRTRNRFVDYKQSTERTKLDFKVTEIRKVVRPINSPRKRPATAFV